MKTTNIGYQQIQINFQWLKLECKYENGIAMCFNFYVYNYVLSE